MFLEVMFLALLATVAADTGNNAEDYRTLGGASSYKLHTERVSWKYAWKICQKEGGHLAVLDNAQEAKSIKEYMRKNKFLKPKHQQPYASIGFHSMFAESHWTTVFGLPLDQFYGRWAVSQPDNLGDVEFCGGIDSKGELVDIPCAGRYNYPFICEKSP